MIPHLRGLAMDAVVACLRAMLLFSEEVANLVIPRV
jgi:hypothetical protein